MWGEDNSAAAGFVITSAVWLVVGVLMDLWLFIVAKLTARRL